MLVVLLTAIVITVVASGIALRRTRTREGRVPPTMHSPGRRIPKPWAPAARANEPGVRRR